MFRSISALVPKDTDLPARARVVDLRLRVLLGTLYDVLQWDFHQERTEGGEYIPLAQRAPSVRYGLAKLVVDESISMLFGEGRFPALDCEDEAAREAMAAIEAECGLVRAMREAALFGSCGSVAVHMRVLSKRPYFDVLKTTYLTPHWRADAPDQLAAVVEQYKVKGSVLAGLGYSVAGQDMAADFWFRRVWDDDSETWFLPLRVSDQKEGKSFVADQARSVRHMLGFVPIVWIRNLPGGDETDGDCTFRPAIETSIEIDYQLSQAGRGLKYSSDPTLLVKEPAATDGSMVKSPANALVVSEGGDAKLLEISGTASAAVIEYVRALREMALESVHGNRSNADKLSAAQSGRAMELMHQALINLVDQLRDAYGTNGLLPLMRMTLRAADTYEMVLNGARIRNTGKPVTLRWPPYFSPTIADKQQEATALTTLQSGGIMSRESAVSQVCETWDVGDPQAEMARVTKDIQDQDARTMALKAQVKANENVEA